MLRSLGIGTEEAENGLQGLAALQARAPIHAVLLDLQLPDGPGYSWAQQFTAQYPGLPIIYLSYNCHTEERKVPGLFYLSKPLTLSCLQAVLSDALPNYPVQGFSGAVKMAKTGVTSARPAPRS
jgi:CheY-like chemotaxis protein